MVIIFIVLDSKNILVVEDDLDIRELISFNLANEGHQVFEANDGEVGIDKARNNNPDLILLDLMLPGIQGLDVCRIIKSDQETKEIPIIMVTALGQEEDIVKGLETGADDYITKPFSIKVLIARVNAVLKRSIEVGEDKSKDILTIKEDIGRHNAVDKAVGFLLQHKILKDAKYLMVSGRVSYEIVTKAFIAKIPVIVAVSACSSLAVDFAKEFGICLIGFTRKKRMTIYANPNQINI